MTNETIITPDMALPDGVHAAVTTRLDGAGQGAFAAFNLADHVGDDPVAVATNRAHLIERLQLPAEPSWLEQVHGTTVVAAEEGPGQTGDAVVARAPGAVCAVLTADCLPVLFSDTSGRVVAAAHAGWRGLAAGVLEETIAAMAVDPATIRAWLGPAIGPDAFAVGEEVRAAFIAHDPAAAEAFHVTAEGALHGDLWLLARQRLTAAGVATITGGGLCTVADPQRFYSHRRDNGVTGRMASLIWTGIL